MTIVTSMEELRIFMKDKEVDFKPNPSYIEVKKIEIIKKD